MHLPVRRWLTPGANGRVSRSREPASQLDEKQQRKPTAEVDIPPVPLSASQTRISTGEERRKPKWGSDAWHVWDCSQDESRRLPATKRLEQRPPGAGTQMLALFFWGRQACIQEKIWKAGEQSFISGVCRLSSRLIRQRCSFCFPRRQRRSRLGGCLSDHEGGYSRSRNSRPLRLRIKGSRLTV